MEDSFSTKKKKNFQDLFGLRGEKVKIENCKKMKKQENRKYFNFLHFYFIRYGKIERRKK